MRSTTSAGTVSAKHQHSLLPAAMPHSFGPPHRGQESVLTAGTMLLRTGRGTTRFGQCGTRLQLQAKRLLSLAADEVGAPAVRQLRQVETERGVLLPIQ